MKVAFFSTKSYDKEYFNRFNDDNLHEITFFEVPLNNQTAGLTTGFEAVCVFVNDKIDEETIEIISVNGIKVIALRCAGFNNVDLKAAKSRSVSIVRVPAYSPESVAEHATALILTLNRKTHKAYNRVREGNFSIENLTGFNLSGKTVGVIGTGLIGSSFCKIMLGFGCKVLAYDDIYESPDLISKGVQYKKLDELLTQSDVISLHCPLTPETAHIINANSISKMKNGVMLINTSRGALINAKDAIEGLKSGKIGYLGIDVYEQEADLFFQDLSESVIQDDVISRLISFPNVLITGHLGFFTKEALEEIATITLNNLSDFENGRELLNEIKS
ncbi:2-hydroxyacid dehydrogenase [Dyadobacter subterraneus]|uniref:2-hydroxyacid dehydrogenase n=1 Tax=Dyadobacter subterraneus TaxID=2773304 RepID=A0ABR9WJN8_9BACT|nr:2-hydroxyacid dehydrogenase [Dyadobacter subterraneus]MBE9464556.1 2-hydroxyacid dehydrogenase [Dyadobacter subterraneus]